MSRLNELLGHTQTHASMMNKVGAAIARHFGRVRFITRFKPAGRPRLEALRAVLHGLRIKLLLRCGYGVVVVGRCRSGKSYLLEKTLPGCIAGHDMKSVQVRRSRAFDMTMMPRGMFAVDEAGRFERSDLLLSFPALRARQVVFAVQTLGQVAELKLDDLFGKRLVVLYLGKRYEYLRELERICHVTP